jgi:SAM-dependent methyltransferase
MGYLNPRPTAGCIGHFYPADYECYAVPQPTRHGPSAWRRALEQLVLSHRYEYPPAPTALGRMIATLAAPFCSPSRDSFTAIPYVGAGKLLDVGCGSGWYAHRMRARGWDVTGLDFSPHAAARVRDHFHIPVHVGTLPHPDVKPESFDAITMGAMLEHVHDPHLVIATAAEALRPGGLLAICVPNLASWQVRHFGVDCWSLELPRHLLHFTPATLRQLVERHGLAVRELRIIGRKNWMHRSLAAAERRGDRRWLTRLCRLPGVAGFVTRWTARTGQADCMTLLARKPVTPAHPTARIDAYRMTIPSPGPGDRNRTPHPGTRVRG